MSFSVFMAQSAKKYGIDLSPQQISQFEMYFTLLVEWNEKINLTAITDPQEVAVKHMIDSLSCYDEGAFSSACSVIDVGTGAGFPGLPLKILRPDIKLTLLDSLHKRTVFLQTVCDALELENVHIIHARAEEAGQNKQYRECYQVALSRAVARLQILAELCLPFVVPGGYFVALKGAQYQEEMSEANNALTLLKSEISEVRTVSLPDLEDKRAVIYIKKKAHTPTLYPRRPGTPEKKPL